MEEHSAVIFNGDGYSEVWQQEAERRGLPHYRTTPEALMVYTSAEVVDLYARYGVLSRQELKARQEIYIDQYCKTIHVEANLVIRMGRTIVYPAGLRFQQELLRTCLDMQTLQRKPDAVVLDEVDGLLRSLRERLEHLEACLEDKSRDSVQEAHHYCTVILPAMKPSVNAPTSWRRLFPRISGRFRAIRKCCSSSRHERKGHAKRAFFIVRTLGLWRPCRD